MIVAPTLPCGANGKVPRSWVKSKMLREAAPRFSRVGVLVAPGYATADGPWTLSHPRRGGWASMLVFTRRGRQRT
jgi:hypothetical protein